MSEFGDNLIEFVINKGNGIKGLSELDLKRIPNEFIQPPVERRDHIKVAVEESIPLIDVSKWDDPKVAECICDAAAKWGFFQIINHGIPLHVVEEVIEAARDFYQKPVEERRKYLKENSPTHTVGLTSSFSPLAEKVMEWKDHLFHFVSKENEFAHLWPPVSRNRVLEYINWARPVIRKLLEVLLNGINVKTIDEEKESALMDYLTINLICYPKCPNPDLVTGSGRHSDVSSITILVQDDVGGLYVKAIEGDGWIHVAPVKGSLIVNIGDVLQIMSNDKYKSIEHRVFVDGSKNRFSVPVFVNPSMNSIIGPLPEVVEGGDEPNYRQIVYSDYFNYFFSKGHDGKQTIDYVKI